MSGGGGGFRGGGGGGVGAAISALGAGLALFDALSDLTSSSPPQADVPEDPWEAYHRSPEYLQYKAEQDARQKREERERLAKLDHAADDLESFVKQGPAAAAAKGGSKQCVGFAAGSAGIVQCYQTAAADMERQAAACGGSCKAAMLRAAASARCVAGLRPDPAQVDKAVNACARDPKVGLKPSTAPETQLAANNSGASQAPPTAGTPASGTPGNAAPQAKTATTAQPANAGKGWVAQGSAEECSKLAQNSVARNTAYYYNECVSDPAARPARLQKASTPQKAANQPRPSPRTDDGCGWYGGVLRPDGSCWVMGATTDDCLGDLSGRVTEFQGYKYCVIGGAPAPRAPGRNDPAQNAAAQPTSANSAAPALASGDAALDACREGAVAPWTVAGCYNLMRAPAVQDRPGGLREQLRRRLAQGAHPEEDALERRENAARAETAAERAVQEQLRQDWSKDALHRYERWAAAGHQQIPENTAGRAACTGRWTYDGTSAGTCDPERARARWALVFTPQPTPSQAEWDRVAARDLPWRMNSEADCRAAGGLAVRPQDGGDDTGLPAQLLEDPSVNQAALRRSWLCYRSDFVGTNLGRLGKP